MDHEVHSSGCGGRFVPCDSWAGHGVVFQIRNEYATIQ